jgi:hypothetical protein
MTEKVVYITDSDKKRLKQLITDARAFGTNWNRIDWISSRRCY